MTEPRTFKVTTPHMHGEDVKRWQLSVREEFFKMNIPCPIVVDGDYGIASRNFTASLAHALGMDAGAAMKNGVTPELRTKIRHRDLTNAERAAMDNRVAYRRRLREQFVGSMIDVHRPVNKIIADSWGYHPGSHDGIDVIAPADATIYAMVKGRIIDARKDGWWGLGAPKDPELRGKGDGITQLEVLEDVGPFKKGYHIGYGHAEHPRVKVGDVVKAGTPIAKVGLANAWHIHLMYNKGNTTKGIGNVDPQAILDYAVKHG